MNIFQELKELYEEINDQYSRAELQARSEDDFEAERLVARKKELNDHSYYLFMFTRLEDHVRERSSYLIERKQAELTDWEERRAWDILPKDKRSDKMFFLNRVALLLDKGSHHYQKVKQYYELRNTIGHGGNFSAPVFIPNVAEYFEELIRLMDDSCGLSGV